jgi:mono/diheme cytochrome c family protein
MHAVESTRGRTWSAAIVALVVVLSGVGVVLLVTSRGQLPDYPPDLIFPTRDDRLVVRVPTDRRPQGPGEVGKLDLELAALDRLGGRTADPLTAPAEQRAALDRFLSETFGSPSFPKISGDAAVATSVAQLGLDDDSLKEGGRLYHRHCLQCHGLSGDGRGPTGPWIDPHPRDFRRGAFKFVSSGCGGKPRPDDLIRTIREGLKGSAMPAFALLPDSTRHKLALYVTYLSIRGEVEFQTLRAMLTEGEGSDGVEGDPAGFAGERLRVILREWERANSAAPTPTPPAVLEDEAKQSPAHLDSVRRGHELFTADAGAGCVKCHQNYGRTAGYWYDIWGTVVRPPDLTAPIRKSGSRPEDLYQRIRGGIMPSGMPAHPTLTDAQVWDVVNFVRALPYPRELPQDVRAKVYPE